VQNGSSHQESTPFGGKDHVAVERACGEFKSGRPIAITTGVEAHFALPVEGLAADRLAAFAQLCAPHFPRLAITPQRARALGIDVAEPVAIQLRPNVDVATIVSLVADAKPDHQIEAAPAGATAAAGIDLAKAALGLPAVLTAPAPSAIVCNFPIVTVAAEAVAQFRRDAIQSLKISAEADMPLQAGIKSLFVVFSDGSAAVVIGEPAPSRPVLVRLHSACLTGDVFGSRRCDCGDQLRLSLTQIDEAGGGIVLYLAQEGRGLGLANKLRAYQLQDAGLDTVDANTTLGFDDDERSYETAARMLRILGHTQVILLTNNPAKIDGLKGSGIEVCGRLPLVTPIHADNRRYIIAKVERAGHRFEL
jgi:GTP cyclohydrolase II